MPHSPSTPLLAPTSASAALLALGLLLHAPAQARLQLQCELQQGGASFLVQATPQADPYTIRAVPIGRHFRFKAVMIGSADAVDYIKLYAYYRTSRKPVLLVQSSYVQPTLARLPNDGPHALTGTQEVYSPDLERQLRYGCTLREEPT